MASESRAKADEVCELTNQLQLKSALITSSRGKHDNEVQELLGKLDALQHDANQSKALCEDFRTKIDAAEGLIDENNHEIKALVKNR